MQCRKGHKKAPARDIMTIATRGFRTLAAMWKSPAEIATRMNIELSENNESSMFVTMFICMFDMKLGRLESEPEIFLENALNKLIT